MAAAAISIVAENGEASWRHRKRQRESGSVAAWQWRRKRRSGNYRQKHAAGSLEKKAWRNGVNQAKKSWQHGLKTRHQNNHQSAAKRAARLCARVALAINAPIMTNSGIS